MGEEKEKIQQADNGQENEVEKQTAESQEKGKNKKNKNALISTIISWVLIGIYLGVAIPLHNKFDNFSTHWLLFGLFALIIPCGTFNFMLQGLALNDISKEKKVNAARRLIIFTFYLWFVDLFYMVSFKNWLVWIYILGIILLLIAIRNLIKVFLGKTEVFKKFILGDLLIALILTAFLIYKIPENYGSLQSIVTTIVAAVYGGMLTLTGVAWTIKRQEETRREDIAKREEERKQEEIAKAKPIFSHIIQYGIKQKFDNQLRCSFRPEEKDHGKILVIGLLENSDNSSFILDKMYYKKWYKLNMNNFVLKNKQIYLYFYTNKLCKEWDEPFCYLKVKDLLGNYFYYKLLYVNDGEYKIVLNIIQEIAKEEAPDDNN